MAQFPKSPCTIFKILKFHLYSKVFSLYTSLFQNSLCLLISLHVQIKQFSAIITSKYLYHRSRCSVQRKLSLLWAEEIMDYIKRYQGDRLSDIFTDISEFLLYRDFFFHTHGTIIRRIINGLNVLFKINGIDCSVNPTSGKFIFFHLLVFAKESKVSIYLPCRMELRP